MRIDAFRFRNLGPFGEGGVAVENLQPGLNVIAERNERGKSSLLSGLELLLFRRHVSADAVVRGLSHAGEGAPGGEIDFTHAGRRYRLAKRFRTGRMAELSDRDTGEVLAARDGADEMMAEMLGSRDAKRRGPSGLLWVRQGNSMEGVSDDGHVAARLESELSTLVGGDRARELLGRTQEQLSELLTSTGKPKKGGPLQVSLDAREAAQAELTAATAAVHAMRETGRELARVREQLAALDAESGDTDTAAQIKAARDALAKAQSARADLSAADARAKRAASEAQAATQVLERFLTLCAEADKLADEVAATGKRQADLEEESTTAAKALKAATDALDALQEDQIRADTAREAERLRERAVDRNARLQSVLANLDAAMGAKAEADELAETLDGMARVTTADLAALSDAERAVDAATLQLERLSVALDLALPDGVTATLDGAPLASGPLTLGASGALQIGGATLRLDMPEAERLRRNASAAERERDGLFETLGVASYAEAASAALERGSVEDALARVEQQLGALAPDGVEALEAHRAQLEAELSELHDKLETLGADADAAMQDAGDVRARLASANGTRNAAQSRVSELDAESARLAERLSATRRNLAALPAETHPDKREAYSATLAAAAATARAAAESANAALDMLRAQVPEEPRMIEARLSRLEAFALNRDTERTRLMTRRTELETTRATTFENRDPDMEAKRLAGLVARLDEDVARHGRRADALSLLQTTLVDSQRALRETYTAPVRRELLPLLQQVIDGADLDLSEDLGATALLRDGAPDALERLSGGTREQIAVLTRLAFARLLARGGQPTPVILDDALVYADDARRGKMFDVLNYVSSGDDPLQLLYLSCHAGAARELGGHRLTLTDWPATG